MHILATTSSSLDDLIEPVDLNQSPADVVVLSFSGSDLNGIAAGWSDGKASLCLTNISDLRHPMSVDLWLEKTAAHARFILVRILGGYDRWAYGADQLSRLAKRKKIPLATIKRERFVVREKGSDTWNSMEESFGRHIADLNIAMEIKSTETIKQAVIAGMGISFLSAHTISLELQAGSLVVLDVQGFPMMLNWYVVYRNGKRLPPVAEAFRTFLMSDGAALIQKFTGYVPQA